MSNILTYKDLQDRVLRSLDEAGDTGTTLSIVKDYIQNAHHTRCTSYPWRFMLWPDVVTFSTTVDERYYTLHPEFGRLLWVRNRETKAFLREAPFRTLEPLGVDWNNDSGSADRFVLTSGMPVSSQPAAASVVSIVSSSTSDTGGPTVIVRGMTADGVRSETLTATGTTTVNGAVSFTARGILQITKTGTWVGTVTVTAGATTLLKLFSDEFGRNHTQLELLRSPIAAETIEYRFFRMPAVLSNDRDIPDIPPPYSEILVYDALLLFAGYNTELNQASVQAWMTARDRLELAMTQALCEGESIGAEVRYVRYLGEDWDGTIRVYRQ